MRKYTDARRVLTPTGQSPAALDQELANEVNKIISAGHYAPWIFLDSIPRSVVKGELYWGNPADIVYQLSEIAPVLPGTLQTSFINYIKSERSNYKPEDVYDLPLHVGTTRQNFSYSDGEVDYIYTNPCAGCRTDVHLNRVGLYNIFALSRYYELTNDSLFSNAVSRAKIILNQDMSEQDWASFYWFQGFDDRRVAVVNANRHFAGMVGYVKLMKMASDPSESTGRALLAKAAVLRVAMAKYARYLYSAGLVELPSDPAWQPKYSAGRWWGYIFNYNWTGAYDDVRQVARLSQFGLYLFDHSGFTLPGQGYVANEWDKGPGSAHLTAFQDMVPEMARLLDDFARQDVDVYINKVTACFPSWYVTYAEAALGLEHNSSHPDDAFQIFMAKGWIQHDTAANLAHYLDIPMLMGGGDFFYAQKLAEAIKTYRGVSWSDVPLPPPSTPTPIPTPDPNSRPRLYLPLVVH